MERLSEAAQAGDINTLYTLLSQDALLLHKMDHLPFYQTPLHISASSGQTSFALELINLKPSFTTKLNSDGYTPIHLASMEGHDEMVRELLEVEPELGVMKGREWRVPLHCAVVSGRVGLVTKLLSLCPDSVKCLTVYKETALHLALKHGQIEAFQVLVESLKELKAEEVVNWKDREGNTVLHLAAFNRQLQVVELLLTCNLIDINVKNGAGLTVLDILEQQPQFQPRNVEIENIIREVKRRGIPQITRTTRNRRIEPLIIMEKLFQWFRNRRIEPLIIMEKLFQWFPMESWAKEIDDSTGETRSALMVVAVLIATVTFQAILSPPGGYNDFFGRGEKYYYSTYMYSTATSMGFDSPILLFLFSAINSIGFFTSLAMITVLTRRSPLKALLRMAVLSMAATYICSITYTILSSLLIVTTLAFVSFTVLLVQWIYFVLF